MNNLDIGQRLDEIASLRTAIQYNEESGTCSWLVKRANKFPGDVAGHVGPNGYRTIMVNYRSYYAHHVAIALASGAFPLKGMHVDHINGDRADNRIANLRVVEPHRNCRHRPRTNRNNASGVNGVWYSDEKKKFVAYIGVGRKRVNLGYFATKDEAALAREAANARYVDSK